MFAIRPEFRTIAAVAPALLTHPHRHLAGMKSLLSIVSPSSIDPQNPLVTSLERRASFWNFARADYQSAYLNNTPTLLDTEDYAMWQSCGLQISPNGSLYADPSALKADPCHRNSTIQLVSHTLLWILLRTMNYLALPPTTDPLSRQTTWDALTSHLDTWHAHLPLAFQPSASLRHPLSRRSSTTTTPASRPANPTGNGSAGITELFFPIPLSAATLPLYHLSRILLLLSSPPSSTPIPTTTTTTSRLQSYRLLSTQLLPHAHAILGIALGRPHPAVRVEMLLPLYAAGSCLEADEERRVVVEVLRAVEADTGVSTGERVRVLEREWGWESEVMGVGS